MVGAPSAAGTSEATATVTVSLPVALLREIDELAADQRRTRDEVIEQGVFYYIRTLRWRAIQAVAAPLAEAAGIRTEDDVEELIDSLPDPD